MLLSGVCVWKRQQECQVNPPIIFSPYLSLFLPSNLSDTLKGNLKICNGKKILLLQNVLWMFCVAKWYYMREGLFYILVSRYKSVGKHVWALRCLHASYKWNCKRAFHFFLEQMLTCPSGILCIIPGILWMNWPTTGCFLKDDLA